MCSHLVDQIRWEKAERYEDRYLGLLKKHLNKDLSDPEISDETENDLVLASFLRGMVQELRSQVIQHGHLT